MEFEDLTDLHEDITNTPFSGKQMGSAKGGSCPSLKAVTLSPACPFLCHVHNIPVKSLFWSRSYAHLNLWEITRHWPTKGFSEVRHCVSQESAEGDRAPIPISSPWWSLALVCGLALWDPFSQRMYGDDIEIYILWLIKVSHTLTCCLE